MDAEQHPLELLARNRPYTVAAYELVLRGLHFLLAELDEPRHVSGAELSDGIRRYALNEFGPMAKHVLNSWGVQSTRDFGEIVFQLVDAGLLRKTEEDSLADFETCFDFTAAFESNYYAQSAIGN